MGKTTSVRILHLSDLHIHEELVEEAEEEFRIPHRYGHSIKAFLALDRIANDLEWDALVISGDITRVGSRSSFIWARNWIENTISLGDGEIGLALKAKGKPYVVVPGNHDRFNGGLIQQNLDNYHAEFGAIRSDHVEKHMIKDISVNFHLFDSSMSGGDFALGQIDSADLVPKRLEPNSLNIAVLHHHLMGPLSDKSEKGKRIVNYLDVISYFLGCKYNALMFGHTHEHYSDCVYPDVIARQLPKKKRNRLFRKLLQRTVIRNLLNYDNISFCRERTRNGQFPTVSKYYEYLFIKNVLMQGIRGPAAFGSLNQFYSQLDRYRDAFKEQMAIVKRNRLVVSMASSACQSEAEEKGFNLVEFIFENGVNTVIRLERYAYHGTAFALNDSLRFRTKDGLTSLK